MHGQTVEYLAGRGILRVESVDDADDDNNNNIGSARHDTPCLFSIHLLHNSSSTMGITNPSKKAEAINKDKLSV